MLYRIFKIFIPAVFLFSCERYPDPATGYVELYSFYFNNAQGTKHFAGEDVGDSIVFISVNGQNQNSGRLNVKFEVVSGDGTIDKTNVLSDKNGQASLHWKLGDGAFKQTLRASVYNSYGTYLTASDLIAYGFRKGEWDAYTGDPDGNIMDLFANSSAGLTLMVANSRLYRQTDRYYEWLEFNNSMLQSARTLHADSNGVIYVSTWEGDIIKSSDNGLSWSKCTKPYPDRPYYIFNCVSNDGYLWAHYFGYPVKISKDGGISWYEAGSEVRESGIQDVFRLKNGALLFHGSNASSLFISRDDGLSWEKIPVPGYSLKLFVGENDEILICTQENGMTIYRAEKPGDEFVKVHNVSPEWTTGMNNTFTKQNGIYYVLIPGYGILKTSDLIHYEDFWKNSKLRDLFIDHNGVFIAKDTDFKTVYYRAD